MATGPCSLSRPRRPAALSIPRFHQLQRDFARGWYEYRAPCASYRRSGSSAASCTPPWGRQGLAPGPRLPVARQRHPRLAVQQKDHREQFCDDFLVCGNAARRAACTSTDSSAASPWRLGRFLTATVSVAAFRAAVSEPTNQVTAMADGAESTSFRGDRGAANRNNPVSERRRRQAGGLSLRSRRLFRYSARRDRLARVP